MFTFLHPHLLKINALVLLINLPPMNKSWLATSLTLIHLTRVESLILFHKFSFTILSSHLLLWTMPTIPNKSLSFLPTYLSPLTTPPWSPITMGEKSPLLLKIIRSIFSFSLMKIFLASPSLILDLIGLTWTYFLEGHLTYLSWTYHKYSSSWRPCCPTYSLNNYLLYYFTTHE